MTHAERVREYCKTEFVDPARARGETGVSIRAGDVHSALGFKNRLPLVCAALGAVVFERLAKVERLTIEGPANGSNTVFKFELK